MEISDKFGVGFEQHDHVDDEIEVSLYVLMAVS